MFDDRSSRCEYPRFRGFIATPLSVCVVLLIHPAARAVQEDAARHRAGTALRFVGERIAVQNAGANSDAAPGVIADNWIRLHSHRIAGAGVTLQPAWSGTLAAGRLTCFAYTLEVDGLAVEGGVLRIVVSNDGDGTVVLASGTHTNVANANAALEEIPVERAARMAEAASGAAGIAAVAAPPVRCWLRDDNTGEARRVWKARLVWNHDGRAQQHTVYLDAFSGEIVRVRDDVSHVDLEGSVVGLGTPGVRPDVADNPPVTQSIPNIRVWSSTGANTATTEAGDFVLPTQPPGATISSSPAQGVHALIADASGQPLTGTIIVFPGVPANVQLNVMTNELRTAQVNAFIHATRAHEFFRSRSDFAAIDAPVTVNVNMTGFCDAYFLGGALNFCRSGSGCRNSAYSTIVAHEYGHFIISHLGLPQPSAFGEGFADALAMLLHDTPTVGAEFYNGAAMRHPGWSGRQYPCSGEIHYCGEVLAGVWWDIRQNLVASYGPWGVQTARQLFVDWAQITLGGGGVNLAESAHPLTAIEVLTVDDDDSDLMNGTPHHDAICAAFAGHGIACPPLPVLHFVYPDGLPSWTPPGNPRTIRVNVQAAAEEPARNSGSLSYSVAGGAWQTFSLVETAPHRYEGALPSMACAETVRYRFSARTVAGVTVSDPASEPAHATTAAQQRVTVFADGFESHLGWSGSAPGDSATTGRWERGDPQATLAQPGDDHTFAGTQCWATQLAAGSSSASFDVDNGITTLRSPTIDLAGGSDAIVSYWRWYSNHTPSPAPHEDVFDVFASGNAVTWERVERIGPDGPETAGGWHYKEFRLSDFVNPTGTLHLRFVASDNGQASTVEAAVDDVRIEAFVCQPGGGCDPAVCWADVDGDCTVDVRDLTLLLAQFGETGSGLAGDIQPNGCVDVSDLTALLAAFGLVCS